jgi:CRP/FNR family cyclic AMP-dependent transcriptional regulator
MARFGADLPLSISSAGRDSLVTTETTKSNFSIKAFLATAGLGRRILRYKAREAFFPQGGAADAVFYLQSGRARLTVVSKRGKEATITLLAEGDFFGEESMSGDGALRTSTASAITTCIAMKIARFEILRVLREEQTFSDFFTQFMLSRALRAQADLVDQLFNSSERRLARTLLILAKYGKPGSPETLIPRVTQETLAEMIGCTRSRVSFFMNRFRAHGYIEYNGRIRVHTSLLNAVLHDELPEENSTIPRLLDPPSSKARTAREDKLI